MLNKPSIAAARRFLAESKNPPESRESEDDVFKVLSWLMGGLNLARIVIYAYVLHIILTALEGGIIVATAAAAVCVLIRLDANYTFCDRLRAHPEILRWIFRRLARPANWLTWELFVLLLAAFSLENWLILAAHYLAKLCVVPAGYLVLLAFSEYHNAFKKNED